MSTSHDPEKSSSETPDHSPSADNTVPRDGTALRGETAPTDSAPPLHADESARRADETALRASDDRAADNGATDPAAADPAAADQQSTLQYQPGHADGDQRAADLYGHSQTQAGSENPGAHQQPGSPQTPGHYSGGHYSNGQFAADQPAGSQQPGAHQYGSQPGAAQPGAAAPGSQPGAHPYGSQPGSYGQHQPGGYGQQTVYAQPTGYGQPAGYGQPSTATPADQRGFFKSLFDFRFNTFVATRWAGIIYILAIVVAVFAWIATIISGIAAGSASRVAMSYWEPEPSFSPWPLLFAILFGWIVPSLWVIFVRLALELIVASVKTAEHTKRLADSIGS